MVTPTDRRPVEIRQRRPRGTFAWTSSDPLVTVVWLSSRLTVFVTAVFASWVLATPGDLFIGTGEQTSPSLSPVDMWDRWDVEWLQSVATDGYGAAGHENNFAFLPGLPLVEQLLQHSGISLTAAGLLVSLIAGLLAALELGRLTEDAGGRAEWGVATWVLAPIAVFLAAPYTEALFCAFAFWAWVLARRGSWVLSCVLIAAASWVRVNGLFLALAAAVAFFTSPRRDWRKAPALLLPFLAAAGWMAYYQHLTGSWLTWFEAEGAGWDRRLTNPWQALVTTYEMGWTNGLAASFAVQYRIEIAVMLILIALGVVMAVKRWWGEATYVLLTCLALGTSTLYYSVPRASLTLFPVWMLLGLWVTWSRVFAVLYVAIAAPMMVVGVVGFVQGHWIA